MTGSANISFLRRALLANSAFSAASGLFLVILSGWLAPVMLYGNAALWGIPGWVLILVAGGLLLPFAVGLLKQAKANPIDPRKVMAIVVMDISWIVLSLIVLAVFDGVLTPAGGWIIAAQAAVVALLAVLQGIGLLRVRGGAAAE